jgi:hypothetical protein
MSIVEQATKASTAKRITYGIDIRVGPFSFNEWGLHESQAKEVNELLTLNGNEPVTIEGVTFTRRAPSELSSALAAAKAKLAPVQV